MYAVALEVSTVHLGAYVGNFTSNFRSVGNNVGAPCCVIWLNSVRIIIGHLIFYHSVASNLQNVADGLLFNCYIVQRAKDSIQVRLCDCSYYIIIYLLWIHLIVPCDIKHVILDPVPVIKGRAEGAAIGQKQIEITNKK